MQLRTITCNGKWRTLIGDDATRFLEYYKQKKADYEQALAIPEVGTRMRQMEALEALYDGYTDDNDRDVDYLWNLICKRYPQAIDPIVNWGDWRIHDEIAPQLARLTMAA